MHEPTVITCSPATFVRIALSIEPSDTEPIVGYGIGRGLGAAGVVQTLTAIPTMLWPDPSVITSMLSAVTSAMSARASHAQARRRNVTNGATGDRAPP
jgi:hypothetical protein